MAHRGARAVRPSNCEGTQKEGDYMRCFTATEGASMKRLVGLKYLVPPNCLFHLTTTLWHSTALTSRCAHESTLKTTPSTS